MRCLPTWTVKCSSSRCSTSRAIHPSSRAIHPSRSPVQPRNTGKFLVRRATCQLRSRDCLRRWTSRTDECSTEVGDCHFLGTRSHHRIQRRRPGSTGAANLNSVDNWPIEVSCLILDDRGFAESGRSAVAEKARPKQSTLNCEFAFALKFSEWHECGAIPAAPSRCSRSSERYEAGLVRTLSSRHRHHEPFRLIDFRSLEGEAF